MNPNVKRLREVLGAIAATAVDSTSHTQTLAREALHLVEMLVASHIKTAEENINLSNALLEAHRQIDVARDAALEEAAADCRTRATECGRAAARAEDQGRDDFAAQHRAGAAELLEQEDRIRALKSQPARRFIDAALVREALNTDSGTAPGHLTSNEASEYENGWAAAARSIAGRLALSLDAAPTSEAKCPYCHERHGRNTSCWREKNTSDRLVYDEPAHHPVPGTCAGCDMPGDDSKGHRFSCTKHGKKQVVLPAKEKP